MLLRSSESYFEAEVRAIGLVEAYQEEGCFRFPYEDCRWLGREFCADVESLVPDLDIWRMYICGFASRGNLLLKLPMEELLSARGPISLGFFEKHLEYGQLKRHITQSSSPDLFERIAWCDETRAKLASLFDFMLREKFKDPRSGAIEHRWTKRDEFIL